MALLWFDGFDNYNNGTDFDSQAGSFSYLGSNTGNPGFVTGRGSVGRAWQGDAMQFTIAAALTTAYFGIALLQAGTSQFVFYDGTTGQVTITFYASNGSIEIQSGSSTLLTTSANTYNPSIWNFIEIGITIGTSNGAVAIRVNGNEVVNLTGQNTQATANASFGAVKIWAPWINGYHTLDDLYLCDSTTGPGTYPNNSFLGDMRTLTLFPVGNGAVQWTPLANSNWQEVSETAMDGDASYNSSSTAGDQDLFNFGPLSGVVSQVIAVQMRGCYRKSDAGSRTAAQQLVSGATQVAGATAFFGPGYEYVTDLWPNDPNTGVGWTEAAVNALQGGYKLLS